MERLFTEEQWRAIAEVESLTNSRASWDGFHAWCEKKRLCGPTYVGGEFYLGWRSDGSEWRVFERLSGVEFSCTYEKGVALHNAAVVLRRIGDYLPELLAIWTPRWEAKRIDFEEREAKRLARQTRQATPRKLGKRALAVFHASEGKCHYCSVPLDLTGRWHIEHKFPRALKGGSEQDNLVAACVPCNMRKRDKTDLEFQALLESERAIAVAQGSQPA